MIQIRIATLKTYGIETRLRDTMSDPEQIEAAIRDEATRWAKGFDANSLLILAKALRGFDVTAQIFQHQGRRCCMCCRGPTSCFRRISRPA